MSEEDLASLNRIGLAEARLLLADLLAQPPAPATGPSATASFPAAPDGFDPQGAIDAFLPPADDAGIDDRPTASVTLDFAFELVTDDDLTDEPGPPDEAYLPHEVALPDEPGLPDESELPGVAMAPPVVPTIRPPCHDDAPEPATRRNRHYGVVVAMIVSGLVATVGWHFVDGPDACRVSDPGDVDGAGRLAADAVARRIVTAESGGDATARNTRSSATGSGQFLDGTWLDMIRAYRPDLAGESDTEILDLRHDPDISREMVARFAEQNAAMLVRRCLPVTPGTLYLSHFAGGAGAAAVLSAPETADAAITMAEADSTGRTTRDMIVTANPFLERFTVADLKRWADRKMGISAGDRVSRM